MPLIIEGSNIKLSLQPQLEVVHERKTSKFKNNKNSRSKGNGDAATRKNKFSGGYSPDLVSEESSLADFVASTKA